MAKKDTTHEDDLIFYDENDEIEDEEWDLFIERTPAEEVLKVLRRLTGKELLVTLAAIRAIHGKEPPEQFDVEFPPVTRGFTDNQRYLLELLYGRAPVREWDILKRLYGNFRASYLARGRNSLRKLIYDTNQRLRLKDPHGWKILRFGRGVESRLALGCGTIPKKPFRKG